MAGIGEDINSVLSELGSPITIYKIDGSVITGEFIDYDFYYDQSTEFIRQNCYAGDFFYNTQADFGDVVLVNGLYLLVLNRKATMFEQESVINNCFMVETNCYGYFSRQSSVRVNMEKTVTWTKTVENVYGLQVESIRDPTNILTPEINTPMVSEDLYVPNKGIILVGDRWYPRTSVSTEYFKVANIATRTFKNCLKIKLEPDTRE